MTTYRMVGEAPVEVDGATHVHGDLVRTAADVVFLVQIGALVPFVDEAPAHGDRALLEALPPASADVGDDASEGVD